MAERGLPAQLVLLRTEIFFHEQLRGKIGQCHDAYSPVVESANALEAGYGTGTLHQPMTAAGSDLSLVGDLAAKITAATALETAGHYAHRLPSEQLTIALQARRGWTGPFDLGYTGNARWASAIAPPHEDCPTCGKP
ncbi:hypothetical protein [Amycolatopsis samaneae]|uniref:Uncharacterized protein n=1 Tax=Amycolatopsis samaneae TaxID=664691 RepID=A0ABW5GBV8_9PSEU